MHNRVQAIAEFWCEQTIDRFQILALAARFGKAKGRFGHIGGACIGCHDQDHIAEVDLLAGVICQLAMIHDLQQNIVDLWMALFDFIEQEHAMGMLIHSISEQAALIKADIAGRRAEQTADGVALHIFRHIETHELHAQALGQLTGRFCFTNTRGAGEQIAANRLFAIAQTSTRQLDRCGKGGQGLILTIDHAPQGLFKMGQHFGIILGDSFGRNARHGRNCRFNLFNANGLFALGFRQQHLAGACLVDHINGFIGQFAIMDIAG